MSVYCTVQEAWGQNFGRRQINSGTETAQNNSNNIVEGFADIDPMPNSERIFTKSGARVYQPDDSFHHSSAKYRQFKASNQSTQPQASYLNNRYVPKSYETNSSQGSDYYDFEDNKCPLGGSRIRSNDVLSEPQLNDEMYPIYPGNAYSKKRVDCNPISAESVSGKINAGCDQSLCDDVALHIMNCPTCQNSVTKIVEKFRSIENAKKNIKEKFDNKKRNSRGGYEYDNNDNDTNEDDENDESSLDVTEIILFIICGIFFVFLLDSIVSIGKRFR